MDYNEFTSLDSIYHLNTGQHAQVGDVSETFLHKSNLGTGAVKEI